MKHEWQEEKEEIMNEPLVSIVIPCFNSRPDSIRPALESALGQIYRNTEILLVDDGSEPGTAVMLEKLASVDPRVHYIRQENGGVSAARNTGVREASGEYIAFLDDDDLLAPCCLAEAVCAVTEYDLDYVAGGLITLRTAGTVVSDHASGPVVVCTTDEARRLLICMEERVRFEGAYVGRGCVARLVRSDIAKGVPFDVSLRYGEDLLWNQQILAACKRCAFKRSVWYYYVRYNESAATKRFTPDMHQRIRNEMSALSACINLTDDGYYKAYICHLLEELMTVYRTELSGLKGETRRALRYELYTAEPWTALTEKRFWHLCGPLHRLAIIAYCIRVFFPAYAALQTARDILKCLKK